MVLPPKLTSYLPMFMFTSSADSELMHDIAEKDSSRRNLVSKLSQTLETGLVKECIFCASGHSNKTILIIGCSCGPDIVFPLCSDYHLRCSSGFAKGTNI